MAHRICDGQPKMAHQPAKSQIHAYPLAIFWLLVLFFFAAPLGAQNMDELYSRHPKARKMYLQAEAAFYKGEHNEAVEAVNKALKYDSNFIEAWLLKAELSVQEKQLDAAVAAYQKVLEIDAKYFLPVYNLLGELYLSQGKYFEAAQKFSNYLDQSADGTRNVMVQALLKRAHFADSLTKNPSALAILFASDGINTEADEYINFIRLDGKQLLFTLKKNEGAENNPQRKRERFYQSNWLDGQWTNVAPFLVEGTKGDHGALTFTADGRLLLFAGCGWEQGSGSCDLYQSRIRNGQWASPQSLGSSVNNESWDSQPTITPDGKEVYFASNRKGGFGGSDLYKSVKLSNGEWSEAINLGSTFNTNGNEMSPFIHPDGKTIYFSSNGFNETLGGSDIYFSRLDAGGRWSKPINVGFPVNSLYDEVNVVIDASGQTAYVSSNKKEEGKDFDIFSFLLHRDVRPEAVAYLRGRVVDAESLKPLEATFRLVQLDDGNELYKDTTDSDGVFLVSLASRKAYALHVEKKEYLLFSAHYRLDSLTSETSNTLEIALHQIKNGTSTVLNNIFFETNEATLQPASEEELSVLFRFLKLNPQLSVEISGHTDSTGNEALNQKLSLLRAQVVKDFLVKSGILSEKIHVKGEGSALPVATNTTEEGKALNRRTEMKIIDDGRK